MAEYIEREAAIALAKDIVVPTKDGYEYRHRCVDPQDLAELPAADVQPVRHGRWIIDREFGNDVMSNEQMVICSECGLGIFWGKQPYCPNCGAYMMDGGET